MRVTAQIALQLVRQGRNLEPANVGPQVQLEEDKVDSGSSSNESVVGAEASENAQEAEIVDSAANQVQSFSSACIYDCFDLYHFISLFSFSFILPRIIT